MYDGRSNKDQPKGKDRVTETPGTADDAGKIAHLERELASVRAELERIARERDLLRKELAAVGRLQTETIALTSSSRRPLSLPESLPSLQELMESVDPGRQAQDFRRESGPDGRSEGASLSGASENAWGGRSEGAADRRSSTVGDRRSASASDRRSPSLRDRHGEPHSAADAEGEAPGGDLVAPDLVFSPEEASKADDEAEPGRARPAAQAASRRNSRLLVFLEADPPIKYPLFKEVITIGRSERADIRIDGDYMSRIHARILTDDGGAVIEDAGSTNGIEVNGRPVLRHKLEHGDVLSLGNLHFTYLDTAARA